MGLLALVPSVSHAKPSADRVTSLPLYGPPPTDQYSGFLDATAGCDTGDNGGFCKLHYWLALAEHEKPWEQPTVLWLNGGPGASALIGFLEE